MAEVRFDYTGAAQSFVVPDGVSEIEVEVVAGAGGDGLLWEWGANPLQYFQEFGASGTAAEPSVVTLPATVQPGDLMLLAAWERWPASGSRRVLSVSPGWDLVAASPAASGSAESVAATVWSRVMQPGDTSVSIATSSGTSTLKVSLTCFRPADGTIPTLVDVEVDTNNTSGVDRIWSPSLSALSGSRETRFTFWVAGAFDQRPTVGAILQQGAILNNTRYYVRGSTCWPDSGVPDPGGFVDLRAAFGGIAISVTVSADPPDPAVARSSGGRGGSSRVTVPVTPGETLTVEVGGRGVTSAASSSGTNAAYPAGATGRAGRGGGTSGAYSRLRRGSTVLVVAGAGGGGGSNPGLFRVVTSGGDGGYYPTDGEGHVGAPPPGVRGTAATTSGHGTAGGARTVDSPAGGWLTGSGSGADSHGKGGGGGGFGHYHGGGGGGTSGNGAYPNIFATALTSPRYGSGGGGGISYHDTSSGVTLIDHASGANAGDGYVIIRWGAVRTGWFLGTHMGGSGWSVS